MWEVFPQQVLDNSLHTSILVGLLITWGLYETLGWVFAGFVVAGYLAALAQVSPASLVVVLLEAVLSYGGVWLIGVGAPKLGLWSPIFGRERFLLFVLMSVPVRLLVTGLAMPRLTTHLLASGLPPEALGPGLFGIGIVLVPLTANTFWKLGITRGLVQMGVVTGLTWAVVGGVLARFTNFHLSTFEKTFDALAIEVHSSTTALLILVTTAWIGAHNNLRFGWDFGGILVPALLGLLMLQPLELVATLAEVVVLYQIYEWLLTTRLGTRLDLEGPRRLVSIYAVSYLLKFALAVVVGALGLRVPLSDVFGFGYLLTSLMVARCHKAHGVLPVLVPTLWTAAQGVLVAMPLALGLAWVTPAEPPPPGHAPAGQALEDHLLHLLRRIEGRPGPRAPTGAGPTWTLDDLAAGLPAEAVWEDPAGPCQEPPELLWRSLPAAPIGVLCGGDGPVLVVLAPRADPEAAWLAAWLATHAELSAVLFARHDPTHHATLADRAAETRQWTLAAARQLAGHRRIVELVSTADPQPRLHTAHAPDLFAAAAHLRLPGLQVVLEGAVEVDVDRLELSIHSPALVGAVPRTTWADVPTSAPPVERADPDLLIDLLLPASRRIASASLTADPPPGLRWLAGRAGADWSRLEDPAGWLLTARGPVGDHIDRWVFRPGGGERAVLTTEAWRWPATAAIALHLHRSLQAGVTWIGSHAPHGVVHDHVPGERSLADRLAHRLLEPLAPGALPWTVLIEVDTDGVGPLHLNGGNEWLEPAQGASLRDILAPGLTPWPGARLSSPDGDELATAPTLVHASRYQRALDPSRLAVLWFPKPLLAEVRGTADHAGRVGWYRRRGVPVSERSEAPDLGPATTAPPGLQQALQTHADLPVDATLAQLRAVADRLEILDLGVRLLVLAESDGLRCLAAAHGQPPTCGTGR
jgi:hypothetical protein